jgi:hypothetical protein
MADPDNPELILDKWYFRSNFNYALPVARNRANRLLDRNHCCHDCPRPDPLIGIQTAETSRNAADSHPCRANGPAPAQRSLVAGVTNPPGGDPARHSQTIKD